MAWFALIFAGCFECMGVVGMNQVKNKNNVKAYTILTTGFTLSFFLLAVAMNRMSMGTAYAVWTGIGTIGSTVVGMAIYNESKDMKRIFFIGLVIISVIGLKLIS